MKYGAWTLVNGEDNLLGHVDADSPAEAKQLHQKKFTGQKFSLHKWSPDDEKYMKKESVTRLTTSQLRRIIRSVISESLKSSPTAGMWLVRQSGENELGGYDVWKYGPIAARTEDEAYELALSMVKSGKIARLGSAYVKVEPLGEVVKDSKKLDVNRLKTALEKVNSAHLRGEEDDAALNVAKTMIHMI